MKARDIVEIKNRTIGGESVVEGTAKLIKLVTNRGRIDGWEY